MEKEYDLSGLWTVCLDEEKKGFEAGYFNQIPTVGKKQIILPQTTDMAQLGRKNEARELGTLTRAYMFEGYAWYEKEINIEVEDMNQPMTLFFERTRKTSVWINGSYIGHQESLVAPHNYDVTKYIDTSKLRITVLVDNTNYKTKGGHMTSPDTQTNWNGILGKMKLVVKDSIYLEHLNIYPELSENEVKVTVDVVNTTQLYLDESISLSIRSNSKEIRKVTKKLNINPGNNPQTLHIPLGEEIELWSEWKPVLYQLEASLEYGKNSICQEVGFREFTKDQSHFLINGQETFLRGKSESLLFPMTGAAPMTVEEWMSVMTKAKAYGINHYRCHTCCLPDAAFTAADRLGIYVQPEISFWGTISAPGEDGYDAQEQEFLFEEGMRILEAYGNHPSFCMMTLGNELWGNTDRMNDMIHSYRTFDPRHLYAQGCNNFMWIPKTIKEDDFFVGVRMCGGKLIRGSFAMCDAPLGFVQTQAPNFTYHYDSIVRPDLYDRTQVDRLKENHSDHKLESRSKESESGSYEVQYGIGVKKISADKESERLLPEVPVIAHEVGQYTAYPNYKEIDKYSGVLKARNLEEYRGRLEKNGMLGRNELMFLASGKLAVQCYKEEIEAIAKSRSMGGYQLLDLQDYSGQGTALVGILDAFMEPKGIIQQEVWNEFCSDVVIMAKLDRLVVTAGECFTTGFCIANYSASDINDIVLEWRLVELSPKEMEYDYWSHSERKPANRVENQPTYYTGWELEGQEVLNGTLDIKRLKRGITSLKNVELIIPRMQSAQKYLLQIKLRSEQKKHIITTNEYWIWSYPNQQGEKQFEHESYGIEWKNFLQCLRGGDRFPAVCDTTKVVTQDPYEMINALKLRRNVFYLPQDLQRGIQGDYPTDFWNYPMFRSISESMGKPEPIGTMGLLINNEHKALELFPSEIYTTPQWYEIIIHSTMAILDGYSKEYEPIVAMIDNFERCHKLALLFEATSLIQKDQEGGKLLVCTCRLNEVADTVEGRQFAESLLKYFTSCEFLPKQKLTIQEIKTIGNIKFDS